MSLEQVDTIDAIGVDKTTGFVTLAISDHLDWLDEYLHSSLLQDKINTYLRFCESGELYEVYPMARNRNVEFRIFSKFKPSAFGSEFLTSAARIIENAGFKMQMILLDTNDQHK